MLSVFWAENINTHVVWDIEFAFGASDDMETLNSF